MKRLTVFIIAFLFFYVASAQTCGGGYLGTKTLYVPGQAQYTKPPEGFEAIAINYAGRHGARHLTKNVVTYYAFSLLMKADSAKALSSEGEQLKKMVLLLQKIEEKGVKSISEEGRNELKGIAARMSMGYPAVFSDDASIRITITKEIRTQQSAQAFITGLKNINADLAKKMNVNDTTLRFYDLSPAYNEYRDKGDWKDKLEALKKKLHYEEETKKFTARFFTASFFARLNELQIEQFTNDIFGFYTITFSIDEERKAANISEKDIDFSSFFTCHQLSVFNTIDEAEEFLLKGPAFNDEGVQVKIAAPLLSDFISSTEKMISSRKPAMNLRFCHAETIAPFAVLLKLKGASEPVKQLKKFSNRWKVSNVIPLSANIQWIIYRNQNSNDCLVKFLLNEKEVAINGLSTRIFPYYSWNDVKKFYLDELKRLGFAPSTNGYSYLLHTK